MGFGDVWQEAKFSLDLAWTMVSATVAAHPVILFLAAAGVFVIWKLLKPK